MHNAVATNSIHAFLLAIRIKTLGAISCPILLGSALALKQKMFSFNYFFITLICSVSLQILANLVNDYGDFIKGSDTQERLGPPRAMQMGWITQRVMVSSIIFMLVLSIGLGLFLVFKGGILVLIVGTLSVLLSLWYTLGTIPLAYLGFSEVFILLFFGPLPVLGAYYVQTDELSWMAFFISFSPAFLSTALIMTNNLRDIVEDKKNRKKTLAVRFGKNFSRFCILSLLLMALISPLLFAFFDENYLVLLSLLALLIPLTHTKMILKEPISKGFNLLLASIGKTLYLFGFLFSFGIIYG